MNEDKLHLINELRKIADKYENNMISKKELIKTLKKIVLFEEKFINNPHTSVSAKELMERYENV